MNSLARFDILFTGALVPGTDPSEARRHIQELFRLSDEKADRLFGGHAVTIKRGVDGDTAARYRERFRAAGALLEIVPAGEAERPSDEPGAAPPSAASPGSAAEGGSLSLAPPGALLGEPPDPSADRSARPDTSHLTLAADGWTLADCAPPRDAPPPPDTSHLRIEPRPPDSDESSD